LDTLKLNFGEVDNTLFSYGIQQAPLVYNNEESNWKAILKSGKMVAILGSNYQVLPNDVALKAAESVARSVGAEPFKPKFASSNAVFSESGTRLYAMYISTNSHSVGGEKIHTGFTIGNAIDGTLAFSCGGFTFRSVCSNGVMLGYKQLEHYYRKHTSGFAVDIASVTVAVKTVLNEMEKVLENYAKLQLIQLNRDIAKKIAESRLISRKVIPDYIETKKSKLIGFDAKISLWQTYNDITREIWHNDGTHIDSKRVQFQILHRIIRV